MWILISWLHKKPADLDLHCFQKRVYRISKKVCTWLFVLILYVPGNKFSVMLGRTFLGCTSAKQRIKCYAQGLNTVPRVWLKSQIHNSSISSYPLYLAEPQRYSYVHSAFIGLNMVITRIKSISMFYFYCTGSTRRSKRRCKQTTGGFQTEISRS